MALAACTGLLNGSKYAEYRLIYMHLGMLHVQNGVTLAKGFPLFLQVAVSIHCVGLSLGIFRPGS